MSAADPRERPLELTLFSSSWKDRLVLSPDLAGAAVVDRRVPVRLLNLAWHRLGWPPAETLTGRAFDVTHSSHPLLLPARAAAQVITIHDLNFLTHPERTRAEIRRDYPALARDHAHRADRILVPSRSPPAKSSAGSACRASAWRSARRARPTGPPRAAAPKDGYVLFFSTLEPRKNVGGLLDAYERVARAAVTPDPAEPDAERQGRRMVRTRPRARARRKGDRGRAAVARADRAAAAQRRRAPHRLRRPASGARSTRARGCSCSRRSRKASAFRCSKR